MKKLILPVVLLFCAFLPGKAQNDSIIYTAEYLDTVVLKSARQINDYSLIGANYGVTFSTMYFW